MTTTDTREQITYMQVRITRMLADHLDMPLSYAAGLLDTNDGLSFIEDCWGLFHVEGDEAVLDDVLAYLNRKGALPPCSSKQE